MITYQRTSLISFLLNRTNIVIYHKEIGKQAHLLFSITCISYPFSCHHFYQMDPSFLLCLTFLLPSSHPTSHFLSYIKFHGQKLHIPFVPYYITFSP